MSIATLPLSLRKAIHGAVVLICLLFASLPTFAQQQTFPPHSPNQCTPAREPAEIVREVRLAGDVVDRAVVELPDRLKREWLREDIRLRYQIALDRCDSGDQQYVWIYRIGGPYRVFADGQPLSPIEPAANASNAVYNGRTPALFSISASAKHLQFDIEGMPFMAHGLVDISIGSITSLASVRRWDQRALTLVNDTASLMIGSMGFILLLGWLRRREDRATLWFACACLLWALRGLLYQRFTIDPWIMLFEQTNPALVTLTTMCLVGATLHSFDTKLRYWQPVLLAWGAGITLCFGLTLWLEQGGGAIRSFAFASSMLLCLGLCVWLLTLHSRGLPKARLLAIGLLISLLGALHDIGMVVGWARPDNWSFLTPAFAVMLLLYGGVLFQYILRQLRESERANELLEARVAEKSRELQASQALLREREVADARAQERTIFQREMHDGLGSHLLATLRGIQLGSLTHPQIETALQEGLDEMRLIINTSDLNQGLFMSALAWRTRWEPRLEILGIELDWRLDEEIALLSLDVHVSLQWLRVMQEAVTNVIKHANASQVQIHWTLTRNAKAFMLKLFIADNGSGIQPSPEPASGRGLANMRARAHQIGAFINWRHSSSPDGAAAGTIVEMWASYEDPSTPPPETPETADFTMRSTDPI